MQPPATSADVPLRLFGLAATRPDLPAVPLLRTRPLQRVSVGDDRAASDAGSQIPGSGPGRRGTPSASTDAGSDGPGRVPNVAVLPVPGVEHLPSRLDAHAPQDRDLRVAATPSPALQRVAIATRAAPGSATPHLSVVAPPLPPAAPLTPVPSVVGAAALQRVDAPAPPPPPVSSGGAGGGGGGSGAPSSVHGAGAAPGLNLDELSRQLYPRLRDRLRAELRIDRERAGTIADPLG